MKGEIFILKIRNIDIKLLYDKEVCYDDSITLEELKEGEKISILSDSMMKTMFLNENRLKYSALFISYYLDISFEELLKNISLSKNVFNKNKDLEKNLIGDYIANIDGSKINIEVNNNGDIDILERNMEYAHRLYSSLRKRKRSKDLEYVQVIQFNINNFYFKDNNKIVDIYYIQNDEDIKLTNKLIFVQIYIPNLIKKWYTNGIQSLEESEKYLLGLVLPSVEDSLKVGEGLNIMKEYVEEAVEASEEDDLLESYDKELAMYDLGNHKGFLAGKHRGEKEGYALGEKEGYSKGEKEGYSKGEKEGYSKGEKEGYSKGEKEGYSKGENNTKMDIINRMNNENISIDLISKIVSLDTSEVKNIISNNS